MIEPKVPTKKASALGGRRAWPLLGILILVAVLVAGAAVFLSGAFRQGPTQVSGKAGGLDLTKQADSPGEKSRSQADGEVALDVPARGDEDAPVVMIEYADFQCPFCGKFARDVEPELIERYVDTGTLKIEWRDFPYLGQESVNATLAARAAQEQGKFWEYHDALYRDQGSLNSGTFSDEKLVALAEEVGLDMERFESDFVSGKYEQSVSQDLQEGQRLGISGTPTFFVNDTMLVGAQPIEVFEEAIEDAAREAEDA